LIFWAPRKTASVDYIPTSARADTVHELLFALFAAPFCVLRSPISLAFRPEKRLQGRLPP